MSKSFACFLMKSKLLWLSAVIHFEQLLSFFFSALGGKKLLARRKGCIRSFGRRLRVAACKGAGMHCAI
jgi:hypothetical protein